MVKGDIRTYKHQFGTEFEMQELLKDIEEANFVVAHNAKFEVQWLQRCGIDARKLLVCDTMLMQWVYNGNRKAPLNLSWVTKHWKLPTKDSCVEQWIHEMGVCPSEIPANWLMDYCFADVRATDALFLLLREKLIERKQLHILHVRNLTCIVLADIEWNGVKLDAERVKEEYEKTAKEMAVVQGQLFDFTQGINLNSTKQKAEFLYGTMKFKELTKWGKVLKTDGGSPLTDTDTIQALKCTNKKQREFVALFKRYSQLQAALSKSLNFYMGVCEDHDGCFRASFNQGTTGTHRLSSSGRKLYIKRLDAELGVQLQNQARGYKRLYRASREGWLLGECDGAQLEFRVAADLGRDAVAREEISNEVDVHSVTRDVITNAGQAIDRQEAKSHTFKPLYGGSSGTDAEQAYYEFFKKKYPGIARTQRDWALAVAEKGRLDTPYGMKFWWSGVKVQADGYVTKQTEIYNYPVNIAA